MHRDPVLSDLLGRLSPELFANAKRVRLAAGNALFLAGDSDDDCYRIEDGLLKVMMVRTPATSASLPSSAEATSSASLR
jgi:CRP-like cAMP-binding protein